MLSWSQVFHYIWAIMIVHIRELPAIVAVTRRACSSHLVSSTFYYIPFIKFILAALPSFFLSNLFPKPWTSINGPKLTTCNFLLRYFHSEYLFPGLYFDFSKSGLWGLTGFDQPLCFPALPPPQPWPSPPWQPLSVPSSPQPCLAIGPPDPTQPIPLPVLRGRPMPGAGAAPVPPAPLWGGGMGSGCHVLPSQVAMQSPQCHGHPAPREQELNLNPLFHLPRSLITITQNTAYPNQLFITCSHFTAVFPSMPLTNFILQFSHL